MFVEIEFDQDPLPGWEIIPSHCVLKLRVNQEEDESLSGIKLGPLSASPANMLDMVTHMRHESETRRHGAVQSSQDTVT